MFCSDFSAPIYYLLSSEVPPLLYYSHIPTALFALFFGIFVYRQNKKGLANKLLLILTILFFFLTFLNLLSWVNVDSRIITLAWSIF